MTDIDFITRALDRLPVPTHRRDEVQERRGEFIDRIMISGLQAGIRPAPVGQRVSPSEIIAALDDIADGLAKIERGLETIDDARRSTSQAAKVRDAELARLQSATLRKIAAAVSSAVPASRMRDVDASLPTYDAFGFSNPWRGAFSRAAAYVRAIKDDASPKLLRTPKSLDEWFVRLIGILAGVYSDATGEPARAYSPGTTVDKNWHPPFCAFVCNLWPFYQIGKETTPSDSRIRDALALTPKLTTKTGR